MTRKKKKGKSMSKDRCTVRPLRCRIAGAVGVLCLLMSGLLASCSPEAPWSTKDVKITMQQRLVSAGFAEYTFSTNKDAYYLIACQPVKEGYNPMEHQKQFMTAALDSAEREYLEWRAWQLENDEFIIAPFASHALQYGKVEHFFTSLESETDYWVYAFVVNPDKKTPAGTLYLETIHTRDKSVLDIHFEYRIKGYWDYVYPVDTLGNIYTRFPFLATTRDSAELTDIFHQTAEEYFNELFLGIMESSFLTEQNVRYGVQAVYNGPFGNGGTHFEPGGTYYTAIAGCDGTIGNNVIYKFKWTGEDLEAYFRDEDSIINNGEND